jgi:sec-independent protein translocase protein TatA
MGIPSLSELIIIFGVVFLLFGAKKLPELGGAIGESIKNFKKGIKDDEPTPVDPNRRLAEAKPVDQAPAQPAAKVENTPITPKD